MTSEFDTFGQLFALYDEKKMDKKFHGEFKSLVAEAVTQASNRKPNWTFKIWMERWSVMKTTDKQQFTEFYGYDLAAEAHFLSATHSVLDHRGYHHKVFDRPLLNKLFKFAKKALGDHYL